LITALLTHHLDTSLRADLLLRLPLGATVHRVLQQNRPGPRPSALAVREQGAESCVAQMR